MNKTEKLDRLFVEWNKYGFRGEKFKVFCKDGIIDRTEKEYKKILFVLKDVNNAKPDEKVDLRESLVTLEGEGNTWFNVARWTASLLEGEFLEDMNSKKQFEQMKKIAVMNIKKEAGGPKVSDECILCYSKYNSKYIREEIKICNPDIIIACSHVVFEALQDNVFKKENYERTKSIEFEDKMSGYGKCIDISSFLKREKPVYIVEYRHPSQATRQGSLRQHHENFLKIKEQLL